MYTYKGSDGPDVEATGHPQDNLFESNTVIGGPQAVKFKESDGSQLINNVFSDPGTVEWSNSTGNVVMGNTGLDEATEVKLVEPACFESTDEEALADSEC